MRFLSCLECARNRSNNETFSESAICVGRTCDMHNDPNAGVRWLDVILRNDWILGLIIIALGAVLTVGLLALFR